MRLSVVINTYNRARSLRDTLQALRRQTCDDFEVVVVNGPSTDDTGSVLAEFAGMVRVADCPAVHLSRSRNIGIAEASGDVVAFIDDDAVPEPSWLSDLADAYDSDSVGGAGGIVYDHTGYRLQYQYSVCDRVGDTNFDLAPPFDEFVTPGADPFLYLQGTNVSFRRDCLVEIGGFDEEIEYYLDETEACMRVIDAGYRLRALDGAAVHHKYLASHHRNHEKVVFDPFTTVKNRFYFALQNGRGSRSTREVLDILSRYVEAVATGADTHFAAGRFDARQRAYFLRRVDEGIEVGTDRGLHRPRARREIPPADKERFLPFPVIRPEGRRLTVCFVSQEYPPGDFGGIGRFTSDLALGFAERGHEVHVVTRSPDNNRVDLEDGVWMHRLAPASTWLPDLQHVPLVGNLAHVASIYNEVGRIHARGPIDLVSAPLWLCEGLACSLDPRFPTVLTLMTSMKTIAGMHPSWDDSAHVRQLIALEREAVGNARYLHPISSAILEKVRADYGETTARAQVVPLGIRDRRDDYPRRRDPADDRLNILFVGRLERRKGVDLLLEAAVRLVREFPEIDFILAGKDTPNTEAGRTYQEAFEQEHGRDTSIAGRIRFAGAVTEDELYQLYADCDVFCLPSRYESFGLVLVEAMMFGKPVIGCANGGMPEVVEDGENGFLARSEDAESLEACLRRLIEDEGLRQRFGHRSRELFERKFSARIMVDQTLDYYRRIATSHQAATGNGGRPDGDLRDEIALRLAGVISRATGASEDASARSAELLLTHSGTPINYLSALQDLWVRPSDQFIRGLFPLLLGREADPQGFAWYIAWLERGMTRSEVVRDIATSDEAKAVKLPTSWLSQLPWLEQLTAPSEVAAPVDLPPPAPVPRSIRLRRRVTGLPVVGKLCRYARRLVYLPWNVHKLYHETGYWHEALRTQNEAIREGRSEVRQLLSEQLLMVTDETKRLKDQLRGQDRWLQQLAESQRTIPATMAEQVLALGERVGALAEQVRPRTEQIPQLAELAQDQDRRLQQVGEAQQALAAATAGQFQAQGHWLQKLTESQESLGQWVSVLQRKLEMLSLDVRERIPAVPERGEWPEPRIIDPETFEGRLARMGDDVRVNLGCGEKPLPDYLNVDLREVPELDIMADARRLPFGPKSLAEIASAHLVEHFREHHLRSVVLPYWKSLLREGGRLRIVCPNWAEMLRRLGDGRMALADFKLVTFGAQDYQGDDHFAMYTPETLAEILRDAGFGCVEVLAEDRQNGLCPEMELVAVREPAVEITSPFPRPHLRVSGVHQS